MPRRANASTLSTASLIMVSSWKRLIAGFLGCRDSAKLESLEHRQGHHRNAADHDGVLDGP
jgi:hypothetical protein